jgi:hypothetical protein
MSVQRIHTTVVWFGFSRTLLQLDAQLACEEKVTPQIRVDPGHPWPRPFDSYPDELVLSAKSTRPPGFCASFRMIDR